MSEVSLPPMPPTGESVQECIRQFETLEKYKLQESALNQLFTKFCPENEDASHVILKVSALNDFYSTNIYDTHSVAAHIVGLGITARLVRGEGSLVNEIARISIGGKVRNFYSFASKYCSHHNPEAFPIYDSYVDQMLRHYRREEKFAVFSNNDLKTYPKFMVLIEEFRTHYGLNHFSLREIDIYLWLAGKAAFKNPYVKSNVV